MGDEKKFACLSKLSVQRMVDISDVGSLADDIMAELAEDATYRLREVISLSAQFMKRSRRKRLKTTDISKALYLLSIPPVMDIGSEEEEFVCVQDNESGDSLYFVHDDNVNAGEIATSTTVNQTVKTEYSNSTISSEWIHVDGQSTSSLKSEEDKALPEALHGYYSSTVSAILGDNISVRNTALHDLRRNCKIFPLIPYFVNFAFNVKAVSHDIDQLFVLLQTVSALVSNPNICLLGYLRPLASSVLYCVLEPLTASINPINDHWKVRNYGSRILSYLVINHGLTNCNFKSFISESVNKILQDPTRPLCSHYGAIVVINALGVETVKSLLFPNLSNYYHTSLEMLLEDNGHTDNINVKEDAFKVVGELLHSLQMVYICDLKDTEQYGNSKFYCEMIELFGDSLALRLPTSLQIVKNDRRDNIPNVQVQPITAKPTQLGNGLPIFRRSVAFAPGKLPSRNISISVRRYHSDPIVSNAPYCHSQYFALSLNVNFIGKSRSNYVMHRKRTCVDFADLVI